MLNKILKNNPNKKNYKPIYRERFIIIILFTEHFYYDKLQRNKNYCGYVLAKKKVVKRRW